MHDTATTASTSDVPYNRKVLQLVAEEGPSLHSAWRMYNTQLQRRPLLTKCLTGVVGCILGDVIAQMLQKRRPEGKLARPWRFDYVRTFRLCLYTFFIGTPIAHIWFMVLDSAVMPSHPSHPLAVLLKVMCDQLLMAPLGLSLFFFVMKCMEGEADRAWAHTKEVLPRTLYANYAVWPLANAINFALVPADQRILYVNIIAVAWSAFLSSVASSPAEARVPLSKRTPRPQPAHAKDAKPTESGLDEDAKARRSLHEL